MNSDPMPPDESRRHLTIWWNPSTNEVELDPDSRLSCFDIMGLVSTALDIAHSFLPSHDNEIEFEPDFEEDE